MTPILRRLRSIVAAFTSDYAEATGHTADPGHAPKAGSRLDRLRPERRDLAAALRADPAAREDELTTWPPASDPRQSCQGC